MYKKIVATVVVLGKGDMMIPKIFGNHTYASIADQSRIAAVQQSKAIWDIAEQLISNPESFGDLEDLIRHMSGFKGKILDPFLRTLFSYMDIKASQTPLDASGLNAFLLSVQVKLEVLTFLVQANIFSDRRLALSPENYFDKNDLDIFFVESLRQGIDAFRKEGKPMDELFDNHLLYALMVCGFNFNGDTSENFDSKLFAKLFSALFQGAIQASQRLELTPDHARHLLSHVVDQLKQFSQSISDKTFLAAFSVWIDSPPVMIDDHIRVLIP